MGNFFATILKELLLLKQDKAGLLVLFGMPAVLVIVITLVQNNAMKTMGTSATEILIVNEDQSAIGEQIEKALAVSETVGLRKSINDRILDTPTALAVVKRGDYQVALIIPKALTSTVRAAARQSVLKALDMAPENYREPAPAQIELYFDPTLLGTARSAIKSQIQLLVLGIEIDEKMACLAKLLPEKINQSLESMLGATAFQFSPNIGNQMNLGLNRRPVIIVQDDINDTAKLPLDVPNAVQQNVPAWSLFGIFFIVLPMAGTIIKERLCGVQYRLLAMPSAYLSIAAGKMWAYMMVCLIQLTVILCIAKWLMPQLGVPRFQMNASLPALSLVSFSAILAATGYGIFLGVVVKSYEQASTLGPISVVIAAALGGIMVPVYAMPPIMQKISLISPLGWAQNAFLNLLVRHGGIRTVLPNVGLLILFGILCISASWWIFTKNIRHGRI